MKKINITFLVLILLFSSISYSQDKQIDSLTTLLSSTKDLSKRIELLESLSNYSMRFDLKKAEEYAQQLIEESSKSNDSINIALGYKLLGNVNHNKSEVDNAINLFRKGLTYVNSKKNIKIKGDLLGSIGNVFSEKQKTDSAFVYWNKAKTIFEHLENHKALTVLNFNFATNYFVKGDYTTTIKYLKETEKHNDYFKNKYFEMRCNTLYGNIFTAVGRYEDAIGHLEKSYKIAKTNNYVMDIVETSNSLASLKAREGKTEEALKIREDTYSFIEPIEQLKSNAIVLSSHISYSYLLIDLGENSRAKEIYLTKVKPYKKHLGALERDAYLLDLFSNSSINKLETEKALSKIYKSDNLVHKIQALNLFSNLFRANKDNSMLIRIQDSLITANQKLNSEKIANALHFTLEELGVEKKEKENLQLKADKAEQAELLAKESKRKWQLGAGLITALLTLAIFTFYYRLNKKQKEVIESLQKELHHRIKNNLSIIDTFIEVAKEEFDDKKFSLKLSELQNRIDSINEVHQQLYNNEDVTNLNLKNYIETLSSNVSNSFSNNKVVIEKEVEDNLNLNADKSFPVGLIINEFLTNSYKYAFGDDGGKVKIKIKKTDNKYNLTLSDNGRGLPQDFDIKTSESFGLRIIKLLAEQLNGSFELNNIDGVVLNISFPK
jgi:two-component sensor histidine kinase